MSNTSDAIDDSTQAGVSAILESNTLIADAMGYTALPSAYKTAIWDAIDATWAAEGVPTVSAPAAQYDEPTTWNNKGFWNAFTNTPELVAGVGTEGDCYDVGVTHVRDLGNGSYNWHQSTMPMFKEQDGDGGSWIDSYNTLYLECTQAEAQEIYGHKVAHALWLEHTHEFPWRITKYSLEECSGLFDPTVIFWSDWNTGTTPYLEFAGIADYDTAGTYSLVNTIMTGYTHRSVNASVSELLDRCAGTGTYPSKHFGSDNAAGIVLTPEQHFSTANEAGGVPISRRGCHTAAPLMAALGRSINLSTRELHDVLDGPLHHSMEFLSVRLPPRSDEIFFIPTYDNSPKGAIMSHGDWIYDVRFNSAPGIQKLEPRGYVEDRVIGQADASKDLQQTRMTNRTYFEYAQVYLKDRYVANDWQWMLDTYIEGSLGTDLETRQATKDRLERDIKARNGEVVK